MRDSPRFPLKLFFWGGRVWGGSQPGVTHSKSSALYLSPFSSSNSFFCETKGGEKEKFLARSGKWKKVTLSSLLKKHAAVGNDLIKGGKRGGENGVSAACEIRGGRGKVCACFCRLVPFMSAYTCFEWKKEISLVLFFCFVFVGNWKALPVLYEYLSEYHPFIFPSVGWFPRNLLCFPLCVHTQKIWEREGWRGAKRSGIF